MKLASMFGSSASSVGMAAAGAAVIVGGAIGFTVLSGDDEAPEVVPAAVEVVPAAVEEVMPEVATVSPEPEPQSIPDSPTLAAPQLDLVRVDPDGNTVIAGQSLPNMPIAIIIGGEVVAEVTADGSGDFVALLTVPASDEPRAVTVEARPEGAEAIAGAETVLIAPFGAPEEPEPAIAAADPEPQPEPEPEAEPEAEPEPESGETPETLEFALAEPQVEPDQAPDVGTGPEATEIAVTEPASTPTPEIEPVEVVTEDPVATEDPVVAEEPSTVAPVAAVDPIEIAPSTSEPTDFAEDTSDGAAPGPDPISSPVAAPGALVQAPSAPTIPAPAAAPDAIAALAAAPEGSAPGAPSAPSVVITGPEGVRIAQGAGQPDVQTEVRLDAISYDATGAVILAGRGPAQADLQVFLNNQPIQLGEVGPGGAWSLQLPDVDPGTYTLSVAEIGPSGNVESRVETPFLREDPERVAEVPVETASGAEVITVQPGFTLWGMAQDRFGEGILYVQIFEENRDQIRDPDWIFPGQIFRIPDIPTQN